MGVGYVEKSRLKLKAVSTEAGTGVRLAIRKSWPLSIVLVIRLCVQYSIR